MVLVSTLYGTAVTDPISPLVLMDAQEVYSECCVPSEIIPLLPSTSCWLLVHIITGIKHPMDR